ncbi:methionine ABC transporter permease [Labrys sp. La1]|uniref:methionine ABC transporter permease n=1 Tax=unclassified Labrys (in: a-proteobacteria) TaxID=2688601 RepID=UPI000836E9DE|nr:methionine ABC transporter permease [Labrys sp. WJW]OCC03633.1 metal ABC transporter permease [Labrys sp. WJW]
MTPQSWTELLVLVVNATGETLYMVALSALVTIAVGLPLGVLLFVTRQGGLVVAPWLSSLIGLVVNVGRSLPFVILLIALIPLTRLIVGTSLGSTAAVVPLTIGAVPFFARIVEAALAEVEKGRIEAVLAMGGTLRHVIEKVLLPEALPAILAGVTLTVVMLVGFSAMAGVVGGGGLGDLAIRYGYQRFNNQVMFATIVVLVVLVQLLQTLGDRLVRALEHRR